MPEVPTNCVNSLRKGDGIFLGTNNSMWCENKPERALINLEIVVTK